MRFLKKFLVQGTALAITILFHGNVSAQNYVVKTAFVGEPVLKNFVVGKIFDETQLVQEDVSNICGIRFVSPEDAVLYKFKNMALDKDKLESSSASACNVIFMIVDFSSKKIDINRIFTDDLLKVRMISGGKRVILIAMNSEYLSKSNLKQLENACVHYGKDNFDYILTSSDEDDETFRKKFFDVTDKLINWRNLPHLIESNEYVINRLNLLKSLNLKNFDKNAFIREIIRQENVRIAATFHMEDIDRRVTALEENMGNVKTDVKDLAQRTSVLEEDVKKLKITVDELKSFSDEQNKSNELTKDLKELSVLLYEISTNGTLDKEEVNNILERVNVGMSYLNAAANGVTDEDDSNNEFKKLRRHVKELKQLIAVDRNAINCQREAIEKFKNYIDEEKFLHKTLIADREEWAQKAIEIDKIADTIKKTEVQLKSISEQTTRDFVWKQYKDEKISWWGRWRLRSSFPFLEEMIKQEKELVKKI